MDSAPTVTQIRDRLGFLADLGCRFLESGQTGSRTGEPLRVDADALGLDGFSFTTSADALDSIDCTRSWRLHRLAESVAEDGASAASDLDNLRESVRQFRAYATPWWAVTVGTTMLAFVIAMQVGVAWQAWVTASVVQVVTAIAGQLFGRFNMPQVFTVALQATLAGAVATALVKAGIVDPVGAAAAIAVNWLLLIPLPQIIGAMNDIIEADHLFGGDQVRQRGGHRSGHHRRWCVDLHPR